MDISPYKSDMVNSLKELIEIKSVKGDPLPKMPYGKEVSDALTYMSRLSSRLGFNLVNMDGRIGYIDYGQGSETLAVLTHLDVVPAGEDWTHDPFAGEIIDDKMYGRGTVDDKGSAIASLYALLMIKDQKLPLNKKVRLVFGCDEESGWTDINYLKAHEKDPDIAFSPDGDYPIINTEKGLLHVSLSAKCASKGDGMKVISFDAGSRPNIVPNNAQCMLDGDYDIISSVAETFFKQHNISYTTEKTSNGTIIKTKGVASHGSRPKDGINAASYLTNMLLALPLAESEFKNALNSFYGKVKLNHDGSGIDLNIKDELSGALTFNVGKVNYDGKELEIVLDIRYPVSSDSDFVMSKLNYHFSDTFDISVKHQLPSHFVDENSTLVKDLKSVYEGITGKEAYCISIGGATYARAFENAVTFGPKFPGAPSLEHGPDEYIIIEELYLNARMIAAAIAKICG